MCVHIPICAHTHTHTYIYMCVCVCVCVHIPICAHTHTHIYIYMCVCVCVYVCVHIPICAHTHTHIYIYMCVCVCVCAHTSTFMCIRLLSFDKDHEVGNTCSAYFYEINPPSIAFKFICGRIHFNVLVCLFVCFTAY